MEGVIILSNNKPLLTSHFARPRLANLAVDAFLAAKRAAPAKIQYGASSVAESSSAGSVDIGASAVEPVIWFEGYSDAFNSVRASSAHTANGKRTRSKGKQRMPSSMSYSDESEEDDSEESTTDEDDDEDDQGLVTNAWATSGEPDTGQSPVPRTASLACCNIFHNGLYYLIPISRDIDPAVPFAYLYYLVEALKNYLGSPPSDTTVRDNFDVVMQIIGETLSAPFPVTPDASALQEIIPSSGLFNRVLTAGLAAASTATSSLSNGSNTGTIALSAASSISPIHWRRAGIRHAQNEIYFDVNEHVIAVLDKNGGIMTGSINGRIQCRSRLSGMPDVALSLSNTAQLDELAFHPCVRLGRWTTNKSVSFVPPDGEFELLSYRYVPPAAPARRSATEALTLPLPLFIKPVITLGTAGGSFSLTVGPPNNTLSGNVHNLQNVRVALSLGKTATAVNGGISNRQSSSSNRMTNGSSSPAASGGSWEFDGFARILRWTVPLLSTSSYTLSGTWSNEAGTIQVNEPSPFVEVTFQAGSANASGTTITNLKLDTERYSVYKGVKLQMSGKVEVRW